MNKAAGQLPEKRELRLVPFRIFRSDRTPAAHESNEPMLHVNTLAQMLYEAFRRKEEAARELTPGVILFREGVVEGLPGPGVYVPDFRKDAFRLTDRIDIRQIRHQLGPSGLKTPLAVGYFQNGIHPDQETDRLRGMSLELAHGLSSVLSLHGNLTDYPETAGPDHPDLPLLSIQWIAEAGD
ncbi:hypothetical protein AV656_13050 [Bhargavaea cecembensis]|uniref:Uncharacterized protein n=1 Tax=Bhargavaea cecembensis TaxID=394098 RepID=A0A165GSI5_9BACL|nr:hypothetical protein [Bhargavaea cecembensis]KZE37485.1 hypothetical protein AV656_13050 [Bhargavaea cecembensis]